MILLRRGVSCIYAMMHRVWLLELNVALTLSTTIEVRMIVAVIKKLFPRSRFLEYPTLLLPFCELKSQYVVSNALVHEHLAMEITVLCDRSSSQTHKHHSH